MSEFWSCEISDNKTAEISVPSFKYFVLSNATIPVLPEDGNNSPIRIFANIHLIKGDTSPNDQRILVTTLVPNQIEHSKLKIKFIPYSNVILQTNSKIPVHLIGYFSQNDFMSDASDFAAVPDDFEEGESGSEEEEEKAEDNNVNEEEKSDTVEEAEKTETA